MSKRKPELKLVEDTGSELLMEELAPEPPPQQGEMPFALVEGQPMTELPRDLYIPPDALQVFLEAFEGPLDLLLYLIRKQNLDILDIPIAEITRQYMKYIDVMADLQLELAGEYLLMAAMLAEIKSRMLLPRPPSADGQEEDDPRAELVRRLQEYERFKKAAEDIDKLARLERDTMPASAELQERKVVTLQPEVTLREMLSAFKDVLSRAEKFAHHHISRERLSQRERMSEILNRLQTQAFFEFTQLFRPEEGRMGVTVTFIAILELMKEGLIEIVQAEAYAPIHVRTAQRHLKVVAANAAVAASTEADAENAAALAQPELEGENDVDDEVPAEAAQPEDAAVEGALAEAEAVAVALGVDEVVVGDGTFAAPIAGADDIAVTSPPAEELSVAELVVVVVETEQQVSEVSVAEIADEEPIVVAAPEPQALLADAPSEVDAETVTPVATDEVSASDTESLATPGSASSHAETFSAPESDEQPASTSDTQSFATSDADQQVIVGSEQPASTLDAQSLATSDADEQAAVDSELTPEGFAAFDADEQFAATLDAQALASESDQHVAVRSESDEETFAPPALDEQPASTPDTQALATHESDEPAAAHATLAAPTANEQPASTSDTQALTTSESADNTVVTSELDQEAPVDTESGGQAAADADRGAARPAATESKNRLAPGSDEQAGESPGSGEQVVEPAPLASIGSDLVREETSGDAQASVLIDADAGGEGEALETAETTDEADELSPTDDSVTESSSEADNSDAEPSR